MKRKLAVAFVSAGLILSDSFTAYASEIICFEAVRTEQKAETAYKAKDHEQINKLSPVKIQRKQPEKKVDLEKYAEEVIALVNSEREKVGLNKLKPDVTLTQMAAIRAKELSERYSHIRPNGESCTTIFGDFSTGLVFYGENAAKGQKTPERVMQAWMKSEGHEENILREGAGYIGVGVYEDEKGVMHWVQIFGK